MIKDLKSDREIKDMPPSISAPSSYVVCRTYFDQQRISENIREQFQHYHDFGSQIFHAAKTDMMYEVVEPSRAALQV